MSVVITAENIKDELKVGDWVSINGSEPSKVTYLYWTDNELGDGEDFGFKTEEVVFESCEIVSNLDVEDEDIIIEKIT